MSHQYQPTAYYDWVNRTHGVHLVTGNYQLVPYDYYAGDELHIQNVVFRNSEYVTYDNTHVRFLNKSDIHVYDTSSLVIHDSGTLTMHTSSAPGARTFIVDEIGRVGIGMNHLGVHANHPESPSFDLDVRGQVGIEDYIYHNDDTDTYMLFGTDTKAHHVNADGSITPPITPPNQDYDEVNFRVGGVDMLQMKEDDTQDVFVVNKNQADVDTIIRTSTNTQAVVVSGDGSEVVINGDGNSDTDFRVEGDTTPHMLYVDTSEDHVTINGAANDDTDLFTVTGNDNVSLSGASLLSVSPTAVVINEDSNLIDTRIESNTNTTSILVKGDGTEVVINDDGNGDTDFRIESDKSEKMLFVDTSTDMITLSGPGDGDDTAIFDIQGNDDDDLTGASLFYVDPTETVLNRDANNHNFRVVAQNLDPQQDTTDTGTDGNVQNHTAALASHALFVDATNGRVGIGHDNPATTLHVAGSAHIEGDLWVKGVTNQIDTLIHATSAMDITNIGTGPALTVTQSGAQPVAVFWDRDNNDTLQASLYLDDMTKMGIGTSSPEYAVHISDTEESQAGSDLVTMMVDHNYNPGGIGINSTNKNHQNHVRFLSGGDVRWQMRQPLHYTTDPDSLRFTHQSRAFDVITMIPTGDVGIGVHRGSGNYNSAPQYRLQIAGDTNGSQDIVQITTNDTVMAIGQEQGLTFGQVDVSFGKIAGFYQGSDEYGLKLYSCSETQRASETRGNFRYNDLAGITLLGDNKTGINIEAPTAQLHVYRGDQHETQSGLTVHRGDTSFDIRATAPILNLFNGSSGSTEVFRVQGDGKTGIGTDDPDTALHVQRHFNTGTTVETRTALQPMLTLAATRGIGHAPYAGFGPSIDFKSVNYDANTESPGPYPIARIAASITNDSNTHTGGSLRFFTTPLDTATSNDDLVENMVIKPSGNIGMGTLVPDDYNDEADNLVVESAGHTGLTIASLPDGDDHSRGNIYFADAASGTGEYSGAITYDHADDNMSFRTSSYERMWIASNGYVGIGTDTPSAKLDIRKGGGSQYATANDFLENPSGQHALALTTGGWRNASVINQQTGATTDNLTLASTGLYLNSSYGSKPFSSSSIHVNCDTSNGDISFLTGNGDTAPTTKVKIINNGNVGIGSSTPHTKLYVESTDGLRIPVGTTSERPTNAAFGITATSPTGEQYVPKLGTIRYNTTQSTFEGFGPGNQWGSLGGVIDVDRDTYWTAINDLDNLHDLGGNKTGTDEFDPDTEYPGDVDYLRAFTQGFKRFAITDTGDTNWYYKTGGNGTTTPYTYDTALTVNPNSTGVEIITPVLQKNIEIKTANVHDESAAQAGDIHIKTGLANNRGNNPGGAGGVGGDLYLTAGDGADATIGQNGGRGGNITLASGTKGNGDAGGGGIDGANGVITLQSSAAVDVNNSGLSVTGALAHTYVNRPGTHLGYSSNHAFMEMKGVTGSYIDFGPGAPNTGTSTWSDHICRIIQTGNEFSLINTAADVRLQSATGTTVTGGGLTVTGLNSKKGKVYGAHLGLDTAGSNQNAYMELKGQSGAYIDFGHTISTAGETAGEGSDFGARIIYSSHATSALDRYLQIAYNSGSTDDGVRVMASNKIEITSDGFKTGGAAPRISLISVDRTGVGGTAISRNAAPLWAIDNTGDTFRIFREPNTATAGVSYVEVSTTQTLVKNSLKAGTGMEVVGDINASGDIIAFSSSDERLKENVTPISDPIEKLSKIGGYEFDWKDNDEYSHTGHDVGVIAQEIEQVLPDIVATRDDGYKAVKYEKLTALLIEVTKSQQAQIDELTLKVEQLSK